MHLYVCRLLCPTMRLTERTAQSFGIYLADTGEKERVVKLRRIGDGSVRRTILVIWRVDPVSAALTFALGPPWLL